MYSFGLPLLTVIEGNTEKLLYFLEKQYLTLELEFFFLPFLFAICYDDLFSELSLQLWYKFYTHCKQLNLERHFGKTRTAVL